MEPSPITSYILTAGQGGARFVLNGRKILTLQRGKHTTFKVVSGLELGSYTFRIAAVNQAGEGAPAVIEELSPSDRSQASGIGPG